MKFILILLCLLSQHAYSQVNGALHLQSFENETNRLEDNQKIETSSVRIVNDVYSMDTTVLFTSEMNSRIALKPGNYTLTCSNDRGTTVHIENVQISSDQITFVDLLFEPQNKMGFLQKRKRRKLYANY